MVGFANIFIPLASNLTKNPFRRYNQQKHGPVLVPTAVQVGKPTNKTLLDI